LVGAAISGYDAVVVAVTDRSGPERSVIPAMARSVIAALPALGVPRLLFVGGGGSLEVTPGHRLVDQPGFPEQYKAEALAQAEALDLLRAEGGELRWSYLSPPASRASPPGTSPPRPWTSWSSPRSSGSASPRRTPRRSSPGAGGA
jgi:putative NADH-flavin reductase